jgi:hypothetical protein
MENCPRTCDSNLSFENQQPSLIQIRNFLTTIQILTLTQDCRFAQYFTQKQREREKEVLPAIRTACPFLMHPLKLRDVKRQRIENFLIQSRLRAKVQNQRKRRSR